MANLKELLDYPEWDEMDAENAPASPLTPKEALNRLYDEYQRIAREAWPECQKMLGRKRLEGLILEGKVTPSSPRASLTYAIATAEQATQLVNDMREAHYVPNDAEYTFLAAFYGITGIRYADMTREGAIIWRDDVRENELMSPIVSTISDMGSRVELELYKMWPADTTSQHIQ